MAEGGGGAERTRLCGEPLTLVGACSEGGNGEGGDGDDAERALRTRERL